MAKIKATITGGGVNHQKAYDRIHHREDCIGNVRDNTTIHTQVNSRPLNSMVEKESLTCERDKYDWKTGTFRDEYGNILTNAQRHITRLKTHTETSGRRQREKEKEKSDYGASIPTFGRRY